MTGPVAQWLAQATHNRLVAGSTPAGPTFHASVIASEAKQFLVRGAIQGRVYPSDTMFDSSRVPSSSADFEITQVEEKICQICIICGLFSAITLPKRQINVSSSKLQ